MNIQWRRGFVRVWVVVSIFWIVGWFVRPVHDFLQLPNYEREETLVYYPDTNSIARFTDSWKALCSGRAYILETGKYPIRTLAVRTVNVCVNDAGSWFEKLLKGERTEADELNERLIADVNRTANLEKRHAFSEMKIAAMIAFIGPIVLLVLASCLGWIFSGFRKHA